MARRQRKSREENERTFVPLSTLELATALWYGKVNLDTANKAEIRLWKGETFNYHAAMAAHQEMCRREMQAIFS